MVKNSTSANNDESSSSSTSPSTSSSSSIDKQPQLVRRLLNKPKLVTSFETDNKEEIKNQTEEEVKYSPASYYEALTGKKLNSGSDLNDSELNMFDENYIEYLRRKKTTDQTATAQSELCPYFEKSLLCPFEYYCEYVHGDVCDLCNMACLNPFDENQREAHKKECMSQIEKDMEEAFAVQRSSEKLCGICMETVWDKESLQDRRFGILENCNHIFCLPCIRKWRASKAYENKIVKACPECRVKSDFITPSKFWFEDEDNKKKIIEEYKSKLGYLNFPRKKDPYQIIFKYFYLFKENCL